MFTAQTIHEISLEEGRQLGVKQGMELGLQEGKEQAVNEMLWLLTHIQSNPGISDAELQRISGLSAEALQALRTMVQKPGSDA
jgi:flagellar biosynthesis/type III secretory pathway protein FliH